jgi:CheY-like chemotaxis protein
VIDDQQINRDLLHSILEPSGYRVLSVASVAEAIACARRSRPALIVSDLYMPRQTGLDLLRTLKADPELRAIGVIIHSATTQRDADRRQALALGARLFLTGALGPAGPGDRRCAHA